jgi:hypothetical protein
MNMRIILAKSLQEFLFADSFIAKPDKRLAIKNTGLEYQEK